MENGGNKVAGLLDGLGQFGLGDLENASLFESPEENETVDTLTPIQKQLQMEQDFLFDKTYACPVCDSEFKVKTIKVGKKSMDATVKVFEVLVTGEGRNINLTVKLADIFQEVGILPEDVFGEDENQVIEILTLKTIEALMKKVMGA